VHDILAALEAAQSTGLVNEKRMGITGGSGGGYLTNWIITKDRRFRAAVSQRTISDWLSFWSTADFSMFTPFWFREQPWENPMEYIERSPAYYVQRVQTPVLFIHAEDDLRTPINQAEAMFRALRAQNKEAVMVRFPKENHDLSRTGSPHRRAERLRYMMGWFDKHLKGDRGPLFYKHDNPAITKE
jgi:dipeptidyl aminopeptidase/acylaminoacyl peptidase